jgi:hypothetical protein
MSWRVLLAQEHLTPLRTGQNEFPSPNFRLVGSHAVLQSKTITQAREPARLAYNGAVSQVEREIPDKATLRPLANHRL